MNRLQADAMLGRQTMPIATYALVIVVNLNSSTLKVAFCAASVGKLDHSDLLGAIRQNLVREVPISDIESLCREAPS